MDSWLNKIEEKIKIESQLTVNEAVRLYEDAPDEWLQKQALQVKNHLFGQKVFYNRNVHFEPTNICVYSCSFCAFYRKPQQNEQEGAWLYDSGDLIRVLEKYEPNSLTEVHITGGVHPDRGVDFGVELIEKVRRFDPKIHIKAFTAVEISFMARKSGLTVTECLKVLKEAGLGSLPGGGAEIFDPEVRRQIAGGKAPAHTWLEVHRAAHAQGIFSNATMLYGHVENFRHRVEHMEMLRQLQEEYQGFNCFIPLRYRNENNALSELPEVSARQELRNYAVSRLFLRNIPHLKAYWVMTGLERALDSLVWGVDDFDGTIDDSTKIYSMAGGESNPSLTEDRLKAMLAKRNFEAVERNSLYEEI